MRGCELPLVLNGLLIHYTNGKWPCSPAGAKHQSRSQGHCRAQSKKIAVFLVLTFQSKGNVTEMAIGLGARTSGKGCVCVCTWGGLCECAHVCMYVCVCIHTRERHVRRGKAAGICEELSGRDSGGAQAHGGAHLD